MHEDAVLKNVLIPHISLARSTLVVMAWNATRLLVQFIWIIMLARTLGASGYGTFSGISGLATALSGVVGLGLGLRLYRDVARNPSLFGVRWAQSMRVMWLSAVLLTTTFITIGTITFPSAPWTLITSIAVAELIATPIVHQVAFAYAAHGRMADAAAAPVMLSISRLMAVALLPIVANIPTLDDYAVLHMAATITTAIALHVRLRRQLTPPKESNHLEKGELADGAKLAALWASGLALNAIDKTAALRHGGADVAGHYTAAHRFTNLMTLPVDALVTALMPHLFRTGAQRGDSQQFLAILSALVAAYGCAAGILIWASAEYLPILIGPDFEPSVPALQLLAIAVPLQSLRTLGANVLLGYGWTTWRLVTELSGIVVILALMAMLVPPNGAVGGAWAIIGGESLIAGATWARITIGVIKTRSAPK